MPGSLTRVDFILVDRPTMIEVHRDFLGDATETDVITFLHGEILICPSVARTQAEQNGTTLENEILLYALHGLLHLAGYDDTTRPAARVMAAEQNRLLKRVLAPAT